MRCTSETLFLKGSSEQLPSLSPGGAFCPRAWPAFSACGSAGEQVSNRMGLGQHWGNVRVSHAWFQTVCDTFGVLNKISFAKRLTR